MFQPFEFHRTHSVKSCKHLSQSMKFNRSTFSLITIAITRSHFLAVTVRKVSQGLKGTSRIRKSVVIGLRKFRLVSADARGGGTRDESLRESAWEAMNGNDLNFEKKKRKISSKKLRF